DHRDLQSFPTRRSSDLSGSGAGEFLETAADGFEVAGVPKDHEDRVVACDCSDDLWPFLPIEGDGDRLCPSGECFDHQEVTDAVRSEEHTSELQSRENLV